MRWKSRWEVVRELSSNTGQGTVTLVRDMGACGDVRQRFKEARDAIRIMSSATVDYERSQESYQRFLDVLKMAKQLDDPANLGALKVLHPPDRSRDSERAEPRMRREIEKMSKCNHPNLLRILDSVPDELWYVSQFHERGVLGDCDAYVGDLPGALNAIRPLVDGVAQLHKQEVVHRDIKPDNIFLDVNQNLVLGDFGLVYDREDDASTRLSASQENVGTRPWMPPWAQEVRLDQVKPAFDVFALGKVLWSMLSGKPVLPLWYWYKPENDVTQLFPTANRMDLANAIFEQTVVEDEADCLEDASALLEEIDCVQRQLDLRATGVGTSRPCRVCGLGTYSTVSKNDIDNIGFRPAGMRVLKMLACDNCGHTELFYFQDRNHLPPAWDNQG